MRIIALSDIHGSIEVVDYIKDELKSADTVVLAGDITNFGDGKDVKEIIKAIHKHNKNVLAIHGNCDLAPVEDYLLKKQIGLHLRCVALDGIAYIGLGGLIPSRIPIADAEDGLEILWNSELETLKPKTPLVVVTHQPAYNTNVDRTNSDFHGGSELLRIFIEKHQPLLSISGHIHEARGVDKIGETWLVNPGPAVNGNYAIIEIDDKTKTVRDVKLRP